MSTISNTRSIIVISFLFVAVLVAPIKTMAENDTYKDKGIIPDLEHFTPRVVESSDYNAAMEAIEMKFAKEMSLYVLAFGLILAIFTGIIAIITKGWNREATNVFTVTIIITAGLFLMTAGYSSEQIAPMYGLLGTIVGYLLGKARSPGDDGK